MSNKPKSPYRTLRSMLEDIGVDPNARDTRPGFPVREQEVLVGTGLNASSINLAKCPVCRTTDKPGGRMEFTASVPLCDACGAAAASYLSNGSDRPGASSPSAELGLRISTYLARSIRRYMRRRAARAATVVDERPEHHPDDCGCTRCSEARF